MNEVIGRQYFGTRDAGDTIFVHMFGAYFGLAVSYMIWDQKIEDSQNKGEDKYSNMFSMVSTTAGNEASQRFNNHGESPNYTYSPLRHYARWKL